MYSAEGEMFDIDTLESMIQKRTLAIGVSVVRNPRVKPKRVSGISLEKLEPKRRKRRAA
jgi:hypothetical protein